MYGPTICNVNGVLLCSTCRLQSSKNQTNVIPLNNVNKSNDNPEFEMETMQPNCNENEPLPDLYEPLSEQDCDDGDEFEEEMICESLLLNFNKAIQIVGISPISSKDRKTKKKNY